MLTDETPDQAALADAIDELLRLAREDAEIAQGVCATVAQTPGSRDER